MCWWHRLWVKGCAALAGAGQDSECLGPWRGGGGDKGYAGPMADILDPGHRLFVGRVIGAVSQDREVEVGLHNAVVAQHSIYITGQTP